MPEGGGYGTAGEPVGFTKYAHTHTVSGAAEPGGLASIPRISVSPVFQSKATRLGTNDTATASGSSTVAGTFGSLVEAVLMIEMIAARMAITTAPATMPPATFNPRRASLAVFSCSCAIFARRKPSGSGAPQCGSSSRSSGRSSAGAVCSRVRRGRDSRCLRYDSQRMRKNAPIATTASNAAVVASRCHCVSAAMCAWARDRISWVKPGFTSPPMPPRLRRPRTARARAARPRPPPGADARGAAVRRGGRGRAAARGGDRARGGRGSARDGERPERRPGHPRPHPARRRRRAAGPCRGGHPLAAGGPGHGSRCRDRRRRRRRARRFRRALNFGRLRPGRRMRSRHRGGRPRRRGRRGCRRRAPRRRHRVTQAHLAARVPVRRLRS